LIAWGINPLAQLAAIPLADSLLEPAMRAGGSLVDTFGWLVGSGPGAGTALLFVFFGLGASLAGLGGYFVPAVRRVEEILPDHDQMAVDEAERVAAGVPAETAVAAAE
jgi:hypothetical protein